MDKEIKTVVVLGMHRSGTSMTSAILEKLGINLGEETVGAAGTNPLGHFEDKMFLELNKRILKKAGGSWDNPPEKKEILALRPKYQEEINKLVSNKKEDWGWKEPRTSLTINLYYPHLSNVYFIYCKRNEDDVAKSLKKRDDISIEEGKVLKSIYDNRIQNFLVNIDNDKQLIIKYEKVLKDSRNEIENIIEFLNLDINENQIQDAIKVVLPKNELKKLSKKVKMINLLKKGIENPYKIPKYIFKKIKSWIIKLF
jgi:hypothetical protein